MQCPVCHKEMTVNQKDTSTNFKNSQEYSRTVYLCPSDDVWISIEIPRRNNEKNGN